MPRSSDDEFRTLQKQQKVLETALQSFLSEQTVDFQLSLSLNLMSSVSNEKAKEIAAHTALLKRNREVLLNSIQTGSIEIQESINDLEETLYCFTGRKPGSKRSIRQDDVTKLEHKVTRADKNIGQLRDKFENKLSNLKTEEDISESGVESFMKSITELLQKNVSESKKNKPSFMKSSDWGEVLPTVSAESIEGCEYGGWNSKDHDDFLTIRRRVKDKNLFIKALQLNFPFKEREQLIEHKEWFDQHLFQISRRKYPIRSRSKSCSSVSSTRSSSSVEFREEQKVKLAAWKQQKSENAARIKEEDDKLKEQEKDKQKEDFSKRARHLLAMECNRAAKQEKILQEVLYKKTEELEKRKYQAEEIRKNLKQFRLRDEEYVSTRVKAIQSRPSSATEREEQLRIHHDKISVTALRDPDRLLSETISSRNRNEEIQKPVTASNSSFNLTNIQHRAVPFWRKGV